MGIAQDIAQKIEQLPPDLQEEVSDFVDFLIEKRLTPPQNQFKLDWRGALREAEGDISSVDLQHQILKDREQ